MENRQELIQGNFSLELIKKVFKDLFNNPANQKPIVRIPSITKCQWEDEESNVCWCWKIDSGSNILYTNDAGKEQYEKVVKDEAAKFINSNKSIISNQLRLESVRIITLKGTTLFVKEMLAEGLLVVIISFNPMMPTKEFGRIGIDRQPFIYSGEFKT